MPCNGVSGACDRRLKRFPRARVPHRGSRTLEGYSPSSNFNKRQRCMQFSPAMALPASHGKRGWTCGWLRVLLVLLLAFDLVSAPWHAHHHDSGVDGSAIVSDFFDAQMAEAHARAPSDRSLWAHATTVLRVESNSAASAPDLTEPLSITPWPGTPTATSRASATAPWATPPHEPLRPVRRSLPPPPQAPPQRA